VKGGDGIHRITPTMFDLSRKAGADWKRTMEVIRKRSKEHLLATPLRTLAMKFADEPGEKVAEYAEVAKMNHVHSSIVKKDINLVRQAKNITKCRKPTNTNAILRSRRNSKQM
jgi:hypothetical protein